jgi:hypothetical protein
MDSDQRVFMGSQQRFTYSGTYAPLPVRMLNAAARRSTQIFYKPANLESKDLLESASRKTDLQDWGDPEFMKALSALLESLNQEGKLTYFGRFSVKQFIIENLCSRLRTIEVLKRFPEIQKQKIPKPIFITGWYRTGTTQLHNLLASHPKVRVPLFWELRHPCPTVSPKTADPRRLIRKVNLATRIHRYLAPGFSVVHPMEAEKPEECLHLFDKACAGTTPFFITEAKSFAWWLLDHDLQFGYDFFKVQLQWLNWLRPGRQWVLKWPYHLWHLDRLLKTFPDATILHLHRDPCEAIPSVCSLAALARSSFCESIDDGALGKFWLDYYKVGLERGLTAREKADANQFIDIRYPDLIADPSAVIKRVLKAVELDRPEDWRNSFQADQSMKHKKTGQHHYAMSQFGLDADQIHERFSGYIENYDLST